MWWRSGRRRRLVEQRSLSGLGRAAVPDYRGRTDLLRAGRDPFLSYHRTILVGAVHLVLQHPYERHAGAWKDPAVKANVYRPGWYRSGSLLHASRFGAGNEVQGVN